MTDISDRVQQSLSTEDSEPPELDLDLAAALIREKCYAVHSSQPARDDCFEETDIHAENGRRSAVGKVAEQPVLRRRRSYQQVSDSGYVFDPVVGVILKETRDLWRESVKLAEEKLYSAVSETPQVDIPSTNGGESAPAVVTPIQKRHILPPVRFSESSIP